MAGQNTAELEDGLYPMRVVTRLTGLNADTVRVWERRYGAVEPPRTEGRARRFTAQDVRRLLLIREAIGRGHAIRDVARLREDELQGLLGQTGALERESDAASAVPPDDAHARLRAEYLGALERFEVKRAGGILARAATLLEPTELILEVVAPILREIGDRWDHGTMSIAHEHVGSAQIKSLLFAMMRLPGPQPGARKVLVTTPPGHLHEFGALIGAFLAAARGYEAIYLGPNLPESEILLAIELSRADLVLLSVVRDLERDELAALDASLHRLKKTAEVWVGLPAGHGSTAVLSDLHLFHSYRDLDCALTSRLLKATA